MRRALRVEPTQAINPLLTGKTMRDLTGTWTRHTIKRPIRPINSSLSTDSLRSRIRSSAADFFFIYCRQILPQIEENIEMQMLEKFKSTLMSDLERKEVEAAYYQRKDNLAKIPEPADPAAPEQQRPKQYFPKDEYGKIIQSIHGDGLSYHTYADIGRYTVFPDSMANRMLPSKKFGRYNELDYSVSQTYGVQTREEGLRITNDLARLTLPDERNVDYLSIAAMNNAQVKEEILNEEQSYISVYQDFALVLLDYIREQELEARQELEAFFEAPGLFDGLVNVFVQELNKSPIRPHLCDKNQRKKVMVALVQQFKATCEEKNIKVHDFAEMPEHLRCITIELNKADLSEDLQFAQERDTINYKLYLAGYHKKCNHHWRPEDIRRVALAEGAFKGFNTGGLFWGEKGCGKSGILAYLTAWAHENNWVNISVPSCPEFVEGKEFRIERMKNGMYLQPELAARMLSDLRTANEQILREMDVDMNLYGKYDMTGVHEDDGEPCPRTWDPLRQCWSDDWKGYLYDVELKFLDQRYKDLDYNLAQRCAEPKKVIDFIDVAMKDPYLATNAIAELLLQVYNQDKFHVLVTLDGFNTWLQPSDYQSFRYVNDPASKGKVPPRDIALVRMLLKFDGHMLRQGVKYLTTTHYRTFNHMMRPEDVDWFDGYSHEVPNLTLDEFRNFVNFKSLSGWTGKLYKEWQIEMSYMECQGNYSAWHESYFKYYEGHIEPRY